MGKVAILVVILVAIISAGWAQIPTDAPEAWMIIKLVENPEPDESSAVFLADTLAIDQDSSWSALLKSNPLLIPDFVEGGFQQLMLRGYRPVKVELVILLEKGPGVRAF